MEPRGKKLDEISGVYVLPFIKTQRCAQIHKNLIWYILNPFLLFPLRQSATAQLGIHVGGLYSQFSCKGNAIFSSSGSHSLKSSRRKNNEMSVKPLSGQTRKKYSLQSKSYGWTNMIRFWHLLFDICDSMMFLKSLCWC